MVAMSRETSSNRLFRPRRADLAGERELDGDRVFGFEPPATMIFAAARPETLFFDVFRAIGRSPENRVKTGWVPRFGLSDFSMS